MGNLGTITEKEFLINTPSPLETRTYKPVLHKEIIEATLEAIDKKNLVLTEELYKSGRFGQQAVGEYRFKSHDDEIGMSIIWQNSYDKTMTLKFVSGYYTYVCSNGQLYGDVGQFKNKHVGQVQSLAHYSIAKQLDDVEVQFEKALREKQRMKEIELTKKTCANLIGQLYLEQDLLNVTQLAIIKKEIKFPSYDYGVEDTLWNLYSTITHSFKEVAPRRQIELQTDLANFIHDKYQLV